VLSPQEIEAMIEDTGGVPVLVGVVSSWGHREHVDAVELEEGGEVMISRDTVRVATGIFPAIPQGTAITVDGEALVIAESRRVRDGAMTIIELAEA
jgi:hypothetical protein